jgi:hypothetical protein
MSKENKGRPIKDQAEDIRKELEWLIGDDESLTDIVETDKPLPPSAQPSRSPAVSYANLKVNSEAQAKKTITALMKFYLEADIIENDEYVKAKKKMDEMTMSSLVYQLQAGERALTILLETIDDGEVTPRMFEVLATLQKSMLDIIKSQTMYLMATEESNKRIARDIEVYRKNTNKTQIEESGGDANDMHVQRGTKDLMRMIQMGISASKQSNIIEPEESSNIIEIKSEE